MNQLHFLLSFILVSLVGAVFVKFAAGIVARLDISYPYAFVVIFSVLFVTYFARLALTYLGIFLTNDIVALTIFVSVSCFLVGSSVYGFLIKNPAPVGILRGVLISIIVTPLLAISLFAILTGCDFLMHSIAVPK